MEPSFFLTRMMGEFQGEDDGRMISFCYISWIYLSISEFQACGSRYGLRLMGNASFVTIWCGIFVTILFFWVLGKSITVLQNQCGYFGFFVD